MTIIVADRLDTHPNRMPADIEQRIWEREPIVVHSNWWGHAEDRRGNHVGVPIDPAHDAGYMWTDVYGEVRSARSKMHNRNRTRVCVHALKVPSPNELISVSWARQLHWQPTLYKLGACPVIASRVGDVVTLAFDVVGPVDHCHSTPGPLQDANRWSYVLYPFIFEDQGEVFDRAWLGVWPD